MEPEQQESEETLQPTEENTPEESTLVSSEQEPTKSVKNFWERLDEVFQMNVESAKMREKLDDLLENFPQVERTNPQYKSFIFQPDRVAISSNEDQQPSSTLSIWTASGEQLPYSSGLGTTQQFSSFRVRLPKSLVNVKSIQLLSAVIPNATQNIPNNQTLFFYYQMRDLSNSIFPYQVGVTRYPGDIVTFFGSTYVLQAIDNGAVQPPNNPNFFLINLTGVKLTRPNYWDLNFYRIQIVGMNPSFNYLIEPENNTQNRTFTDYQDLESCLNACAGSLVNASADGDVSFVYNQLANKFVFVGEKQATASGPNTGKYYYLPCGYEDPNISLAIENALQFQTDRNFNINTPIGQTLTQLAGFPIQKSISEIWSPGYNLALRLGFTWNGILPNPFSQLDMYNTPAFSSYLSLPNLARPFLRPQDPGITPVINDPAQSLIFNSYADLVNTSCVRIYTDVALASTDEGVAPNPTQQNLGGLLSVIPVNATNLGVGFYQNNFNNPLKKVPRIISEFGIRMVNDQGQPFYLPNSATVILELAIEYY